MKSAHERLQEARKLAGYDVPADAARALGVALPTYWGHENGHRRFTDSAELYARKYGVSLEWLLTGRGPREPKSPPGGQGRAISLVGYVGAGSEAHFTPAGELGRVEGVPGATDATVAVEIRGESLGPLFDRWVATYEDMRRPVTPDLIGKLCVVGLEDGRVLVKKIQRSKTKGLYHLISGNASEPPIFDVAIDWAVKVKNLIPH